MPDGIYGKGNRKLDRREDQSGARESCRCANLDRSELIECSIEIDRQWTPLALKRHKDDVLRQREEVQAARRHADDSCLARLLARSISTCATAACRNFNRGTHN
jgi:hypothetical protein